MIIPHNRESNYVLNIFQNKCNIMFLIYHAALVALLSDTLIIFRGLSVHVFVIKLSCELLRAYHLH